MSHRFVVNLIRLEVIIKRKKKRKRKEEKKKINISNE